MTFFKSKKGAGIVLALCVVFALLFGGMRSVRAEQRKMENLFFEEMDSLSQGRIAVAFNLVSVGNRAGINMGAVQDIATELRSGEREIEDICALHNLLTSSCKPLVNLELSDEDEREWHSLVSQLDSYAFMMHNTQYDAAANRFNNQVYASPLARLFGAKEYTMLD